MRVLIACEESQRTCTEFRARGHECYSADIQSCSGGHPEWHIMGDCLPLLNGHCQFETMDGNRHEIDGKWDLIIAHPPCTYLSTAATQSHSLKVKSLEQIADRTMLRIEAMMFFMEFVMCDCDKVCIENPQGVMSANYRKPDQYIHPYEFVNSMDDEDFVTKKTGLWLKGLPLLNNKTDLPNPMEFAPRWGNGKKKNWTESNHGSVGRSKSFKSISKAMAETWG